VHLHLSARWQHGPAQRPLSAPDTVRIVLADDHPVLLDGVEARLALEPDLDVVDTCTDGLAALRAVETHRPDVLVIDHRMPRCTGIEAIRRLRAAGRRVAVVLLSASLPDDDLLEALHLGRVAVVLKEAPSAELITSIRAASEDRFAFADSLLDRVLHHAEADAHEDAWPELTPREIEVVHQVAGGSSNKRVARDLGIVEGTVKMHMHSIFRKLDISNRVQLAALAFTRGVLEDSSAP